MIQVKADKEILDTLLSRSSRTYIPSTWLKPVEGASVWFSDIDKVWDFSGGAAFYLGSEDQEFTEWLKENRPEIFI